MNGLHELVRDGAIFTKKKNFVSFRRVVFPIHPSLTPPVFAIKASGRLHPAPKANGIIYDLEGFPIKTSPQHFPPIPRIYLPIYPATPSEWLVYTTKPQKPYIDTRTVVRKKNVNEEPIE